jgi:hypothetical protein
VFRLALRDRRLLLLAAAQVLGPAAVGRSQSAVLDRKDPGRHRVEHRAVV